MSTIPDSILDRLATEAVEHEQRAPGESVHVSASLSRDSRDTAADAPPG